MFLRALVVLYLIFLGEIISDYAKLFGCLAPRLLKEVGELWHLITYVVDY